MDLYSAAKRLNRPFVFTADNREATLPIAAHGIIGDGFSCALVRVDGAIDWLCFPRFDSPSVFGALLDPERGGLTSLSPRQPAFESLQRYDPDTNVLETLFRVEGQGVVRMVDYMPWSNDPRAAVHEVHRRVQCVEGSVDMTAIFDPRFGYGREKTTLEVGTHGVLATDGGGQHLVAVLQGDAKWQTRDRGGMEAHFTLRTGERRWMVLSWDTPRPEPLGHYRPFDHLRSTRQSWREWSRSLNYEGPWRHHVMRSALVLKLLIYAPTGAMVAAPTTSLPEWLGGVRNWDYRYVWTRDAALAIRAANLIGYSSEARDFFHFVRDALQQTQSLWVMYSVDGLAVPEEVILPHWSGYAGSAPVRIGNGARDQLQLDTAGALVDAAYLYERFGGALPLRTWRQMRSVIDNLTQSWKLPDDGIWEPRGRRRHNLHSKLMSWLAFDRGALIAPRFGDHKTAKRWRTCADEVREEMYRRGFDSANKHFRAQYDSDSADATLLLLPIHGFCEATDPAMAATIERVQRELCDGPFVYRYRDEDGIGGEEGAFLLCGFWLAEALAMVGRLDEAQEVFTAHVESGNHLGLLTEEIDPSTGFLLGNFPQAFSHLGLINTAARIDLALRLRDDGLDTVPHLMTYLKTEHG